MDQCKCESEIPPLKVCRSNFGFYIGRECGYCGPFSRESGYYKTHKRAEKALNSGEFGRDCFDGEV